MITAQVGRLFISIRFVRSVKVALPYSFWHGFGRFPAFNLRQYLTLFAFCNRMKFVFAAMKTNDRANQPFKN